MRHLPFWFLVAWKHSGSPKRIRVLSSELRQGLVALSVLSHGGGDSGLALTTSLSSCVVVVFFQSSTLSTPNLVSNLHCTQNKACSSLSLIGDIWKGFCWFRAQCDHAKANMKDSYCVKLLLLWGCPLDLYEVRWWDRWRSTRLEHAMVLVNSEIRTKVSFLQNYVHGFIEPGCVESRGLVSCQEADTFTSEKLSLSFTLPLHSLQEESDVLNLALTST